MFRFRMNLALANGSHEEFVHFDFRNIQAHLLIVKTGKLQQIPYQERHTVGFAVDDGQEFHGCFPVVQCPFHKGFRITLDRSQRRTQFVGNVCHKFFPHIVQFFLFCNILQYHHNAFHFFFGVVVRRECGVNKLLIHRECDCLGKLIPHIQIYTGADIKGTDKMGKIHIHLIHLQHFLRCRIGKHQLAILGKGDNTVTHVMQNDFHTVFLFGDFRHGLSQFRCHVVETAGKLPDFVIAADFQALVQLPFRHVLCPSGQCQNRSCQGLGKDITHDSRQKQGDGYCHNDDLRGFIQAALHIAGIQTGIHDIFHIAVFICHRQGIAHPFLQQTKGVRAFLARGECGCAIHAGNDCLICILGKRRFGRCGRRNGLPFGVQHVPLDTHGIGYCCLQVFLKAVRIPCINDLLHDLFRVDLQLLS